MFNTIFGLFIGFWMLWVVGFFLARMCEHGINKFDDIASRSPWSSHRQDDRNDW